MLRLSPKIIHRVRHVGALDYASSVRAALTPSCALTFKMAGIQNPTQVGLQEATFSLSSVLNEAGS